MKKMKYKVVLGMLMAGTLLTSGCAVYNGTSTDIPLFQEKGEWQVEAGGIPLPLSIYYLPIIPIPYRGTVSFSATDRVGLSLSGDLLKQHVQAMGGIYTPVDEHFVWELYGGLALGRGKETEEGDFSYIGHYVMPFAQVDCGWRDLTRWMHLDVAFALRAGALYGETDYSYYLYDQSTESFYTQHDNFQGLRPMLEPSMEVRFGWNRLKFNVKIYRVFVFGNGNDRPYGLEDIPTVGGGFGFGMSYRFGGH